MKIAHVACVYPPYRGGIGATARDFAELGAGLGHDVTVFTAQKNSQTVDIPADKSVKVRRLKPFLRFGNGAFLPQLFWALKKMDIIHLHYPFFGAAETVYFFKIIFRKKVKLIIHYHMDTDGLGFIPKLLSVFSRIIESSLFRSAEMITYASREYVMKSSIGKLYQRCPEKFFLLPFGVDTERYLSRTDTAGKKALNILFVGGLDKAHYFKGVEILLEALTDVLDEDTGLTIVGRGELKAQYEAKADSLGIGRYVRFCDDVSDEELPAYYRAADIFVLPSINSHEAFGLVLLEAMASGVPVVASGLPGVREVFADGVEGFFAAPRDKDALRDKIVSLMADSELRRRMGENGRMLALTKYSFEVLRKKLSIIYSL